jgi:hypothetical protein
VLVPDPKSLILISSFTPQSIVTTLLCRFNGGKGQRPLHSGNSINDEGTADQAV